MKFPIPETVFDQIVAILAKTRSGKSSVMRLMVEHCLDRKMPVVIIDPKGDWWGLKLDADGTSPGYPIIIFGDPKTARRVDIPINEKAGAAVAELITGGNRPALIDMKGWTSGARSRFWIDFAGALFKLNRGKRWLFADEFHNFAPKGRSLDPQDAMTLHWANRIASEGLGLGIHLVFASQRPQKVHNDVLTSAETLIAMRVLHPADRKAIVDWIDGCGDPKVGKVVLDTLAQMKRGEGWVWSPEAEFGPERIQFQKYRTYDSFKPQEAADDKRLSGWADVDLEQVKAKLGKVIEEATANDPAELRKKIANLEIQLRTARAAADALTDAAPVLPSENALNDVRSEGWRSGKIDGYAAALKELGTYVGKFHAAGAALKSISDEINALAGAIDDWAKRPVPQMQYTPPAVTFTPGQRNPGPVSRPASPARASNGAGPGQQMGKAPRKILTAIVQFAGSSKERVAAIAGYSPNAGHFNNTLGELRTAGWVEPGQPLQPTDAGVTALGAWTPLPTGAELIDYWRRKLSSPQARIFNPLVDVYPTTMTKDQLAEASGFSPTAGHFNNTLGELRTLELVTRGKEISASPALFGD